MKEKFLGDYVNDFNEVLDKELSITDKLAVIFGMMRISIHDHPQEFLDWTDEMVNTRGRRHPHHDILISHRREAVDRVVEKSRKDNNE